MIPWGLLIIGGVLVVVAFFVLALANSADEGDNLVPGTQEHEDHQRELRRREARRRSGDPGA